MILQNDIYCKPKNLTDLLTSFLMLRISKNNDFLIRSIYKFFDISSIKFFISSLVFL